MQPLILPQKFIHRSRQAFTLVELLVVMVIICILAALLMPMAGRMLAQGRSVKCLSSIRQLGVSALRYAGEHEMTLPVTSHQRRQGGKSWSITLQEYAGGTLVFKCPCDEVPERVYTYVINDFLTPNPAGAPEIDFSVLPRLSAPADTVLFAEASKDYVNTDHFHFSDYLGQKIPAETFMEQVAVERHSGSANYLFADAHVETLTWPQAQLRLQAEGSRFIDPTAEASNH